MTRSCLVEPLVPDLVGSPRGPSRSRLRKSRLAATALALSALFASATSADATDLFEGRAAASIAERAFNPHQKPAPIPSRVQLESVCARRGDEDLVVDSDVEAPRFETDALLERLRRRQIDIGRDGGPGLAALGLGQRLARLVAPKERTFMLFASGQHQSGAPNPALS